MHPIKGLAAAFLLTSGVVACAPDAPAAADEPQAIAPAIRQLEIRARDYHFDIADTVDAGLTNIRLVNEGPELHHVQLVRLEDGHTVDELTAALAAGEPWPAWAIDAGGPNTPMGPGENSALVELEPGTYGLLCVIPSPDGTPHIMKGMVRQFTVRPTGPSADLPAADLVMTLDDYSFATDGQITAGEQTIRIQNNAAQSHEVVFVRLEPGKTWQDFAAFAMDPQGPPPGVIVGGITGIARGRVNQTTVAFEPGQYALLCFVPDAGDGRPHIAHGMAHEFIVE